MKNNIKHYREKKGWSQKELADKSGISRATINGLESGQLDKSNTVTVQKISRALGESVTNVFNLDK
ncbi:MAG: helix-turn-helix transcriptional regulator [Breznakia sp.]